MNDFKISLMENSDVREAAAVLSAAMLDNPLHVAVFRGKGEPERIKIEAMFLQLFTDLPGTVFIARERRNIIGVLRMNSCRGGRVPDVPDMPEDREDTGWRRSVWQAEWARHDPPDQHWHLGPVGVLPSCRGNGAGSELMRRFCREVDACSASAYLETDLEVNVRFYEKFGFGRIGESRIFHVPSHYMLREPSSAPKEVRKACHPVADKG